MSALSYQYGAEWLLPKVRLPALPQGLGLLVKDPTCVAVSKFPHFIIIPVIFDYGGSMTLS